jgi:hypothetical protein
MVRGTTRKKWVMVALRSGMNVEGIVEAVASLPVAAKDEARKTALAKELKDLARRRAPCTGESEPLPISSISCPSKTSW